MSEQLLTILKLCLLALLYLFFLRVLRAVWSEVTPAKLATAETGEGSRRRGRASAPKAAKPPRTPRSKGRRNSGTPTQLVVVEPAQRAGDQYALGQELTVGRAGGCSIVLDEQYVSQVHSRIFMRDGSLFVEDLGSTNGTWVNGNRAVGQMPARPGDRIQVGNVVMEVR